MYVYIYIYIHICIHIYTRDNCAPSSQVAGWPPVTRRAAGNSNSYS